MSCPTSVTPVPTGSGSPEDQLTDHRSDLTFVRSAEAEQQQREEQQRPPAGAPSRARGRLHAGGAAGRSPPEGLPLAQASRDQAISVSWAPPAARASSARPRNNSNFSRWTRRRKKFQARRGEARDAGSPVGCLELRSPAPHASIDAPPSQQRGEEAPRGRDTSSDGRPDERGGVAGEGGVPPHTHTHTHTLRNTNTHRTHSHSGE